MTSIEKDLREIADDKYAAFQAKLCPEIAKETVLGVRIPLLRTYAKTINDTKTSKEFLSELPHRYYDENVLHSLLLNEIKDVDLCLNQIDSFLPFVNTWAVSDTLSPKVLKGDISKTYQYTCKWIASNQVYTCRFGIITLMRLFLDEHFTIESMNLVINIKSDEYYVNMARAWYFATALGQRYDDVITVLVDHQLDKWTHNKSIQKAIESLRIIPEQKNYLKTLRWKN